MAAWVHVSTNFDAEVLTKKTVPAFSGNYSEYNESSPDGLQQVLIEAVRGKEYTCRNAGRRD